ncbi:MAG: hypothetical protein RM347_028780 [Nostoc sp. ChiQUE02]|uniref:hypothetical protein n=1 Tax=Nostoc sp. ChiQUE02 TaxID=3075377 RepID=UPI002AD4DEDB|nr:hypothetical protein [Nostoc sp. ChiQUE02]MDZ8233547.1 hypothetical protein [Nostoc sp. ChiQUE02]
MAVRIKATCKEFEAACADGCVYGEIRGKQGLYVYAELGSEKDYTPSQNDNPMTEYRLFTGCNVYFAETREQQTNGDFNAEHLPNVTVVIYC